MREIAVDSPAWRRSFGTMRDFGDIAGYCGSILAACMALGFGGSALASGAAPGADCLQGVAVSAVAEAALDGMTVQLKDGRVLRLAGVVADRDGDGAEDARRTLNELVAGRPLALYADGKETDRHGRVVAQATGEAGEWVQAALARSGRVDVMPGSGRPDCAAELLHIERQARSAGAGLWRDADLSARRLARGPAQTGRFAVVEDTVRRVGESGGRLFLDFGNRYAEDFTIVIPREAHAAFAAAGIDLRSLAGRRVRARGVLFSWGGPAMELRVPAALELVETGAP